MEPERYDYAVWWSEEDQCHLARAVTMQAATGYGNTPAAALADAIEIAKLHATTDGYGPIGSVMSPAGITWTPERIRDLRASLYLTQEEFAALLNVTPHAVRHWEIGFRNVSSAAARLLEVVAINAGMVNRWTWQRERAKAMEPA